MQERTDANLERMQAKTETNYEKSEVIPSVPVSRMDIHETRKVVMQLKTENLEEVRAGQENQKEN